MSEYMMNESKPFSSGTEYEIFLDNYCHRCKHELMRKDAPFPEFPENGGCPILDAMENARFRIEEFPTKEVVEVRDTDGKVLKWHYCTKFEKRESDDD